MSETTIGTIVRVIIILVVIVLVAISLYFAWVKLIKPNFGGIGKEVTGFLPLLYLSKSKRNKKESFKNINFL